MPAVAPFSFFDSSDAFYWSYRDGNERVEELTVDLHEAILSLDVKSVKRLVSEGAEPNLPVSECFYKDWNGRQENFKKRLAKIQHACLDHFAFDENCERNVKLNAINLILIMRSWLDEYILGRSEKNDYRCGFIGLERGFIVDELAHFLIHNEKTNLGNIHDDDNDDKDDDPFYTPVQLAKKWAADFEQDYPRKTQHNGVAKLLREIMSAIENKERNQVLSKRMTLLQDFTFADVTFQCPDGEVSAHKCVLATHVEYFATAFSHSWRETTSGVWKTDKPKDLMEAFVKYIYTGLVSNQVLKKHAHQLLLVSCEYQMTQLQRICIDWLVTRLSMSNVCDLLHCSHLHNIADVKMDCLIFLKKNAAIALGNQQLAQFGVDNPELWNEVHSYMKSPLSGQKRKRK